MTNEEAFLYVCNSYVSVHYRQATSRRLCYRVGYMFEDLAQEAKLPSDPSPYRRDVAWDEDDRVLFLKDGCVP
jgi:hypothetical protein